MSAIAQDRTEEFRAAVASQNRIQGSRGPQQALPQSQRTEFSVRASGIARDIAETTDMLQRLALLAKRKPMFDDKPVEITDLTYVIKQKLSRINDSIKGLQVQAKSDTTTGWGGNNRGQLADHSRNVVVMLQGKLGEVTSGFTEVLETRTRNMQQSKERTERFIPTQKEQTPDNPLYAQTRPSSAAGRPASAQGNAANGANGLVAPNSQPAFAGRAGAASPAALDHYAENPYASGPASSGPDEMLTLPQQEQSLVLLEDQQSSYLSSRSMAVDAIESTINELGSIFSQLSTMVAEQRETVQRIDANTEDISLNVSGAHRELLKYYARVSSNRWLMFKSFGVVLFFFFLWVLIS